MEINNDICSVNNLKLKIMNELLKFITKTNNINGCSFATIKGYTNSNGEVANHLINLGATLSSAKEKDLFTMQHSDINALYSDFNKKESTIKFDLFKKAFIELYDSLIVIGKKNYDGTIKVQGNQSKAQIEAYTVINSSIKVHNEFERLYIYGLRVKKDVLIEGIYPEVNKQDKTLCKDYLKKALDFKHTKFVMYMVEKADVMNLKKTQFNGADLTIKLD